MKAQIISILFLHSLPPNVRAGRIPDWNKKEFFERPCQICEESSNSIPICFRPDKLRVDKCIKDEMIYIANVPKENEISQFYKNYTYYKSRKGQYLTFIRAYISSYLNSNINILKYTGGLKGKSLLEIGCSYGNFLQLARARGAEVFGVELDEHNKIFKKNFYFYYKRNKF
jgi:hypothetical protein